VTEHQLQRQAEDWLTRAGFLWHHCAEPWRCRGPRGFPDLVAVGRGLVVSELKGPRIHWEAGQLDWRYTLQAAGVDYQLWQEHHWRRGIAQAHLRAISR